MLVFLPLAEEVLRNFSHFLPVRAISTVAKYGVCNVVGILVYFVPLRPNTTCFRGYWAAEMAGRRENQQ